MKNKFTPIALGDYIEMHIEMHVQANPNVSRQDIRARLNSLLPRIWRGNIAPVVPIFGLLDLLKLDLLASHVSQVKHTQTMTMKSTSSNPPSNPTFNPDSAKARSRLI